MKPSLTRGTEWPIRHQPPRLEADEVHVWLARLEASPARVGQFRGLLCAEEQDRAERFRFAEDRRRFILARGILRTLLGHYLGIQPREVHFHYNAYGKPALAKEPSGGPRLEFNLAHAGGQALYAFTWERAVGVDLEPIQAEMKYEDIARHFFALEERTSLAALPPEERAQGFFNCWTRKEAYLKARGEGLSIPLEDFHVSLAPDAPAALLGFRERPEEASRWSLMALDLGPGLAAALAVEGPPLRVRSWRWPVEEIHQETEAGEEARI